MPLIFYTEQEHLAELKAMEEKALALAKLLSARVPRQGSTGLGGKGCILEPGAESEYCSGCASLEFCPSPDKQFPS